jgi:hypothetical protein
LNTGRTLDALDAAQPARPSRELSGLEVFFEQ